MSTLKTRANDSDVMQFIGKISDPKKREDAIAIIALMQELTQFEPKMWGNSIIGFGNYHYKYESGREGDWFLTGFSPRKQNLTIYLSCYLEEMPSLKNLGKFKHGKSCIYIKRLDDIHLPVLKELIRSCLKT